MPLGADRGPYRGRRDQRRLGGGDDLRVGQGLQGLGLPDGLGLLALGVVRCGGGVGRRTAARARRGGGGGPVGAAPPTPGAGLRLGVVRERAHIADVQVLHGGLSGLSGLRGLRVRLLRGLEGVVGVLPDPRLQQVGSRVRGTVGLGGRGGRGGRSGLGRSLSLVRRGDRGGRRHLQELRGRLLGRAGDRGNRGDRLEQRGLVTGLGRDETGGLRRHGPQLRAPQRCTRRGRSGLRGGRTGGHRGGRPHRRQVGATQGLQDPQARLHGDATGLTAVSRVDDSGPVNAVDPQSAVRQTRQPLGQRNPLTWQGDRGNRGDRHCAP